MPAASELSEFAGNNPRSAGLISFLGGALMMASFAPTGWYFLAPLILVPLFILWSGCSRRRAAWIGFWFGAGLFLTGTYWLYISIHVFGEAPLAIAIFLMIALVIIMGLYYALTGWLVARLANGNIATMILAVPSAWVIVEWLRGWILSGFPWMSLGYAQIDSPFAGFAPLVGVYGVSFVVVLSAVLAAAAVMSSAKRRYLLLALALAPWLAGGVLRSVAWTEEAGDALRVTLVQGGIPQDRKWLPEQFKPTLDLYRKSLEENPRSDLIIWPEVAIPAAKDQIGWFIDGLRAEIARRNQSLLFGVLERDLEAERVYNSVVALTTHRGEQVYRKRHLVPFGEYFPVPGFVREWMRLMSLPHSDISSGDAEQALIELPDDNHLAVAICYEDAYGAEQLYALPEASLLINVSNDAWFGDSIAPHQHLEIARMRALEAGRYAVRATNNGISAFIGPGGELLETGAQFSFVSMTRDVVPRTGATPYTTTGNWAVILMCLLLLAYCYRCTRDS